MESYADLIAVYHSHRHWCAVLTTAAQSSLAVDPFYTTWDFYPKLFYRIAGQLDITGHEEHLIIGISRDIVCSWNGDANVTKMEWFLVGLGAGEAIETVMGKSSILLTINPSGEGLDGTMYTCKATTSDGQAVEESITLNVKGRPSL